MTHLIWFTHRSEHHQQRALAAAPPMVEVTMLRDPSREQRDKALANVEIVVSERSGVIDKVFLDAAPHLKLIVRLGSLAHDIDVAACQQRGIAVSLQPVRGAILVAEHLMMVTLALLKRLNHVQKNVINVGDSLQRTDENTFNYNWNQLTGVDGLLDKRVSILGMGEIGVEVARRLQPFRPQQVLYHKRTAYPQSVDNALGIQSASLERCCREADVLINLLPYSMATDLLLNIDLLKTLPKGAIIAHAGSGSTVDEKDAALLLEQEHLGGIALDTFEYEPLQERHPLVALRETHNVILTPHVAGGTMKADHRQADYAEVRRFIEGKALRFTL